MKAITICTSTEIPIIHTKSRIIKNVAVMSIGVVLLFTSYDGLAMLQSTMNSEQGIGVMSQAVLYICYCVSSLIFPKYVIKKLGSKLTYAISMLTYIPYIASNFYPHWSVMIPTSILIGLGASLLWGSQANYLNDVSVLYADFLTADCKKHSQSGNDNSGKEGKGQPASHGLSGNIVPADYRERLEKKDGNIHSESECQCIKSINIEHKCEHYQSENCEKYPTISDEIGISSQKTLPHIEGHPLSCENRPYYQDKKTKNFISFGNTNLNPIEDELKQIKAEDNRTNRTDSIKTDHRKKVLDSTTARFFGVHGMIFLSSHLWSNLMSYYVLRGDDRDYGMVSNFSCMCGAGFCNVDSVTCLQDNMQLPSDATRYLLTGVCVCLSLVSVVVVFLFLDPVEVDKEEDVSFSLELLAATFKLAKRTELLLLMPASLYLGMAQGFFAGEFNKSFVGCAWGSTAQVGPVAICYGMTCALSSLASGWAVRVAGRPTVLTAIALLNAATCALLTQWTPHSTRPALFFVAAGMWGAYVGTVWAQLRAFYGVLFKKDEEAAFATFHMWYSLGFCLSFAFSNYLCTAVNLYVLLAVSTAGFAGYFTVERWHANNKIK